MSFYEQHIFPRFTNWFLANPKLNAERQKALATAHGVVLEVGFASGLNLPFYPNTVTSLIALDPSQEAFALAKDRIANAAFPIQHIAKPCESAGLPLHCFDCVVTTWTLCTVRDPMTVLKQIKEFLKPDGVFLFLEHGRSFSPTTRRLQNCWNPIHRRLCAGCNINRPIDSLVEEAGFQIGSLNRFKLYSPEIFFATYRGVATPISATSMQPV